MEDEPSIEDRLDAIIAGLQFVNVTLMRLYDVQSAILSSQNSELWDMLDAKHEQGLLHNGYPFLREEE